MEWTVDQELTNRWAAERTPAQLAALEANRMGRGDLPSAGDTEAGRDYSKSGRLGSEDGNRLAQPAR